MLRDALVAKLLVVWKALPTELGSGNGKQREHGSSCCRCVPTLLDGLCRENCTNKELRSKVKALW